ncbi:MAG: hypothetical protein O2904_02345 [bacterium]|nr:hypothetical protein [bacterium]
MKRFLVSLALVPLLVACGNASVTFVVTTDVEQTERKVQILSAGLRVIERRMASMGEELINLDLRNTDTGAEIDIAVANQEPIDSLVDVMTEPFNLRIMKESGQEDAQIVVEGHGGFINTPVNEMHIDWLHAAEEPGGKGRITITFTDEGRELMSDVFKENIGKSIGLFVRNQLVSKLLVETDKVLDDIIITDIPTVQLANVFADDMNVGLHATFITLP